MNVLKLNIKEYGVYVDCTLVEEGTLVIYYKAFTEVGYRYRSRYRCYQSAKAD